jgi:hypothetical protein
MELKKNKRSRSKTEIVSLITVLALFLGGCAVPFETVDTKNVGETEVIVGYTIPSNFAARADIGVTGYTDLGIGLEAGGHLGRDAVLCAYLTGKQKILTFEERLNYNILISGAYGVVATDLNPENIPYYHYTLLLSMGDEISAFIFGIGVLQDPRFSWTLMHEEFSKEKYIHAVMGAETRKLLFQVQTVHKSGGYINFGFGLKL